MARVNYSAQSAGISMNTLIGMLTVGQEVSQRAPEEVGNAWRTVISRMQNVKAGKFTANYSDMDSSDYNEEDWAALNDVETVLKTVGVTMRETATSWRSDEEVLNEVASKWSSFDDVTRSAIANAMAGTRQREQFILMMQNWESVQDYAEMAANSYGAATQKMEAYTNSIEAAKNRVTSAWEEISLNLDLNGRISDFYNMISFFIENLTALSFTLGSVLVSRWVVSAVDFLKTGTAVFSAIPAITGRIQAFGKSISGLSSGFTGLIQKAIIKSRADDAEANASRNAASADEEEAASSRQAASATKSRVTSLVNSISNLTTAASGVMGGFWGAQAGASIGKQLGGDTGETVGAVLGGTTGTGLVSIGATLGSTLLAPKVASLVGTAIAPGVGTALGAALGGLVSFVAFSLTAKKEKEAKKKIEAAQDEFKETTSTLSEVQGVKKYAKTIDDLRSGVDSFGNNLALTEEEYAEFLEANNQIASTMPSLVSHYDENGNAILNLGQVTDSTTGKVKTLSDVISEEIDRLSREADRKLVSEEIFGESLKTAKEKLEEAKEETQEKRTELNEEANSLFERENQLKAKKLYDVSPEESAQIDKELKDVATRRDQIQAELDSLNNSDEASEVYSDELSENVNAALRRNSNYSNLTTDQQAIIQRAVMANAEEIIGAESTNEAIDIINNTVDAASDFFNSEGGKAALTNLTNAENATTAREQYDNRILVGKWLNGKKNLTDADIAIAKAYGYEYKNGQFTDNENIIQNILRAYGVKDTNALGGGAAKYLSNLSPDDARQFIKYGNQGLSFETSKKVFAVDSLNTNTYDGAIELIKTFASFNTDDVEAYFKTIQSGATITAEEVAEKFPMVPEETRNAIQTAAQDIADSEKITAETVSEAMDDVNSAIDAQLTNVVNSANKMSLKDWFTSDWDTNDNGIIDTFKELKNVLDELAESYDKLKDAQKEQNSMGHLSFQTALDLVTSNEAYLNCLHIENGQIKLNTNAKKTLALAQMQAAQSSLDEMRANLMKEASNIASALSTGTLTETTNGEIEASAEAVKASNDNATAVATEGKVALATALAISKLNRARQGKENLTDKEYQKLLKEVEDSTEEERVETEITAQTVSNGLTAEQRAAYEKNWKAITSKDWSDNGANDVYAMEEAFQNGNDKAYTTQGYTGLLGISGAISQTLAKSIKEEDVSGWIENYETPSGDAKEAWERIKDIISAVNKEYQQMVASSKEFADNSKQISTNLKDYLNNMSTQYYDALEVMYNKELKALAANQYFGLSLTEINNANFSDDELSDALEVYKETQEVQTKLAGLDNEKVQDKIDILETQGEINDAIIAEYRNLVKTADNTAQRIEYEEKLNEKLREQVELTKTLKQYQKKIYDFELQYESGTPDSQKYKTLMKESKENLEEQMKNALAAAKVAYNNAYNDAYSDYIAAGYSEAVAKSKAAEEAEKNSDYQSSMEDYMEAYQAIGDLIMQEYNDHINVLQRKMTELENSKPNEWASDWDENNTKVVTSAIDKIKEYYNELESYYSDMADQAYETLTKHAKELTDEQIQELTEKYNEAMKNIRDNAVTLHEQIKTYQESVYSALTAEVNRYKEQLEKQKELTEDAYDKELEKLNDKNEAIERTNKLLELQQNLLNANKEKEKVYRQGKMNMPISNYIG